MKQKDKEYSPVEVALVVAIVVPLVVILFTLMKKDLRHVRQPPAAIPVWQTLD